MANTDFAGVDIDRVVRGAMPQAMVDVPKIQKDLTNIAGEEAKAKAPVIDRTLAIARNDQDRVHAKYEGIEPVDVKPWDAQKAAKEINTPPMEQFGSWGVIAATLASAFTRTPMINALNGAAAAMDSIQKRDDVNYERAYTAWKDNTNLAIKRHEMQRQGYDDAIKLMGVDRAAGAAELQALAEKFGDKRTKALLDGGYIKELIDYQNSQRSAYQGILNMMPQMEKWARDRQLLQLDPDYQSDDPQRKAQAIRRVQQGRLDPMQEIYEQYTRENPDAPAEKKAEFYKSLRGIKPMTPQQQALQTFIDEGVTLGTPRSADEIAKFLQGLPGVAGRGANSNARSVENKAVEEIRQKAEAEGKPVPSYSEALAQHRKVASSLPAKERLLIETQVDQFDNSMDKIDASLSVLDRHVGAAGLAGRATRLAERVGNILGSNATDREQFMRDVQYLRLAASRLLTESRGRPLAAEAQRVNDIVGGLDLGDTTANSIRALEELKTLYAKMRADNLRRYSGTWQPRGEGGTVPPPAGGSDQPWLSAPLVK